MFIKWRTYQRQFKNKKTDKYIQQPIIVHSARLTRRQLIKMRGEEEGKKIYAKLKGTNYLRPRQYVIMKLPSFSACMVQHFDNIGQIQDRQTWWDAVDQLLATLAQKYTDIDEAEIQKLKDDIESYVPRVDEEDKAFLARAKTFFSED